MPLVRIAACALLLAALPARAAQCPPAVGQKSAVVPNAAKALAVARAAFSYAYDAESLKRYEPFRAELVGRMWHVSGSPGAPEAKLCQASGAVVSVRHAP